MNKRAFWWLVLVAALGIQSSASAQRVDSSRLVQAASQYREAVVCFERVVLSIRGIQTTDERLVDKLEEATKRLRLAAQNPRHSNRLRQEWRRIQPLQNQVEDRIFGKYTLHYDLICAWENVLVRQAYFLEAYRIQVENPNQSNRVRLRTTSSSPNRFVPGPTVDLRWISPGLRSK